MKILTFLLLNCLCCIPGITNAQSKTQNQKSKLQAELISEKEVGEFPYFPAPENYTYKEIKARDFEEKYFFNSSKSVNVVEGKYFKATIFPKSSTTFNVSFLLNYYKKLIDTYNGKVVYTGLIPDGARIMINKENPAFAKDLYDPMPYSYKQFLIKTKEANIWVELIYGINADLVDFTVVREEVKR